MANKVKFNLKNVHWAKLTLSDEGVASFGTVHAWPGAVSLSLDAEGETTPFYADGIVYYTSNSNNGYSGDFESALVPELFKKEILGETEDAAGVLAEISDATKYEFALMFEFDGDVNARRHVMYRCAATRPAVASQTNEDNITPRTETLNIKATPLPNHLVKCSTGENTSSTAYNNWYNSVYVSGATSKSVRISGPSSVVKDQTITLTATANPTGTVSWSSNDTSVATVTSGGVVEGVAAGKCTIMATLDSDASVIDTKTITVTAS